MFIFSKFRSQISTKINYDSATLSSFVGNREIKPSNKTNEEIAEGFSLTLITPSRACEHS